MKKFNMKTPVSALLLICMISFFFSARIFADDLKTLHEKTFKINPGKSLKIDASSGDIAVTTWDKPEVYIKISGNQKAEDNVEFNFENNSERVEVTAKKENSFLNWTGGIKLRFDVKVPVNFNPDIYTAGGDLRLAGVSGKTNLKTSGGDVSVKYTNGDLNISTSGGDIILENNKGNIKASTSGGDIAGENFEGNLKVSTSGGDIKLTGKNSEIKAATSGGDIDVSYSGENKGIDLNTSGGDIRLYLPSNFNAHAKLTSSGGSVKCDFAAQNATKISTSKFEADLNSGGNLLIAKTSGGNIRVNKQ